MIIVIAVVTVLFGIAYWIYRTAQTEQLGFLALAAWVLLAALDLLLITSWGIWNLLHG